MYRILLIDDDEHLAAPLAAYLKRFDFELAGALRPSAGLARLRSEPFDAAILDVMLPEMDGFELCRTIRKESDIPIVMLTARGEVMDRVVGLELGADDYLPKPFEPRELAARLQTVLRRRQRTPAAAVTNPQRLVFDGLEIDMERRQVFRQGEVIELTGTEFELLALLAGEPQKVFSRDEILNRLRGHDADLYTRAVDILVSRLRKKLEPLECIKTLRNAGYAFAGRPPMMGEDAIRRQNGVVEARGKHSRPRWGRRFGHSLGLRLIVVFIVLALALTLTFLGGMRTVFSGGWRDVLRPLVADYVDRLAGNIGTPPDVARARALTERLPLSIRIDGPQVTWASHPQRRHEFGRRDTDLQDQDGAWWLLTRETADGHRIRFGLGDAGWQHRPRTIGWATLAVLLLLTAAAYAYVRHLLRPLRDIRAGAVRFGQGDFSQPIAVRRRDELGELAGQVNAMASGLRGMLDAKRQLLLAISHELRSPLTRARLNAELVSDSDDNRTARDALLRDLAEMRDLVTDLLESERLSTGHAALQREDADLNDLVNEVVAAHFAGKSLRIVPAPGLPRMALDRLRMKLLLRNLLENALRHGGDAPEPPRVETSTGPGGVTLTVRDFGPGVPEDHLPNLANAFYRVDAARQRATGGVGLGLHLCQLVVQAHCGQMIIRNAHPGLAVDVVLPSPSPEGRTRE